MRSVLIIFATTLIELMMRRGGDPTDTSRDYDDTDWDGVEGLDREFASALAAKSGSER